ncbi:MAG: RdgB/HAM1 family non-canonical purine NTP pyrophosphatase [Planctomycetes bacterium]|nr:RdgB/HAM1 family non-canonical purine NTP pyrophosphatase [Planctomycetota bacterium]
MPDADSTLLVASSNKKKLAELVEFLRATPVTLRSLADVPAIPEPAETGATFAENAEIKARAYSSATGLLTLADDSGLEVDALGGAPGVHSARYAAPETGAAGNADDAANRAKLLRELEPFAPIRRTARFRCAIAVARGSEIVLRAEGRVEGFVINTERGSGGFGYDPLFVPLGHKRTFAEMTSDEKAALSHRGRALRAIQRELLRVLA